MSCFSLRGEYDLADNAVGPVVRVFDYVSPDRTRAWKVSKAYVWPITVRADVGGDEGKYLLQASLLTDIAKIVEWNTVQDPTDNRAFAWASWAGYSRENGASDFITPEVESFAPFIIDPDTIIVKELWLVMASSKEGTTNPSRRWGWMIELEEVKVSASQSVFQQIKGMGQDITG